MFRKYRLTLLEIIGYHKNSYTTFGFQVITKVNNWDQVKKYRIGTNSDEHIIFVF